MKTISWIELSSSLQGGFAYNEQARAALAKEYTVENANVQPRVLRKFRPLKFFEIMARLLFLQGKSDLWVRNFYAVLTFPFDRTQGKHIAVRHHADFSGFPWWSQPFFMLQEKLFEHNAKRLDALVVVSAYWKNHFEKKGFSNVRVIYNGFDLKQFFIGQEETVAFQKKYGIEGKPVVYLGNCQKAKGVVESWKALQSLDVHLVTS